MSAVGHARSVQDRPATVPVNHRPTTRGRRVLRGPQGDPAWARPGLLAVLAGTALLYLVNLTASGWANDYYAAAAQAGSKSWTAWFFGGLDAGGAITVDKPPAALWVMGLSMRLFGVNSAALLVPQALMGVATVALVYGAVRRLAASHVAGLVAAGTAALTPAAVVVFRFDNPDALLVLLLTAAAYAVVRAVESGGTRWLVLAGACVGIGFLTKMGEALLVLPAMGAAYVVAGPLALRRRLTQLVWAGVAVVVSSGWYVAVAALWPASSRPYIAGSTDNSVLGLALGYNGFGRLLGSSAGSGAGGSGGAGGTFSGSPGLTRLFRAEMAVEISWLLPGALLALLAGLWLTRRAPRTDRTRAGLVLWGGWLLVAGLVFDEMQGTIHPYYTAALVPAISGIVAVVGAWCWRHRDAITARGLLAAMVVVTAVWSAVLLHRADWGVGIAVLGVVVALVVAASLLAWPRLGRSARGRTVRGRPGRVRLVAAGVLVTALLAGGAGSSAWAVGSASSPQTGNSPTSGPAAAVSQDTSRGGPGADGMHPGGPPSGASTGGTSPATGDHEDQADPAVVKLLTAASSYRWAAATTGSMSAAPLQLASGSSVLAIGGFTGSDPSPTLAQFRAWVADGDIKYYVVGSGGGGARGGDSSTSDASAIASWVAQHYPATTVGSATVYDLQAG